jgi:serine/threonine protein phosphatase PrpC
VQNFWNKLFGKKKNAISDVKTAPLTEDQLKAVTIENAPKLHPSQLIVGCGQSIGKQREHNEDTIFALSASISGDKEAIPFGIFIVADGMGGHQHGEVASNVAARSMGAYLVRKLYQPFFGVYPEPLGESLQELLQGGVQEAQQAVVRQAPGGGTTLTAAIVLGDQVSFAHVGDSRAYFFFPDGRIQQITRDHSLVWRLQELGQITEKEASVHPQRNVLYRAIGQGDPFEPDINTLPFPRPGFLMMCSDGLWGVVPEQEIFRMIHAAPTPTIACQQLIDAANEAGGPDNISVILVYYPN